MNILLIGNGFDLAHKLPTTYKHFLDFCIKTSMIYTYAQGVNISVYIDKNLNNWNINNEIKDALKNAFMNREFKHDYNGNEMPCDKCSTNNSYLNELYHYIDNNVWLEYFHICVASLGDNWIDFESEISRVIQILDEVRILVSIGGSLQEMEKEKQKTILTILKCAKLSMRSVLIGVKEIDNFVDTLDKELRKLIRALEIYIVEFVGNILEIQKNGDIETITPDCVLSFNYSDTYEKLYGINEKVKYDYIHGKADINNTVESNNMVLGIDEYLPKERRNIETYFVVFKKYYQRIYKGTGCEYKNWIYEIKESGKNVKLRLNNEYPVQLPFAKFGNNSRHNLYIFGHSLDITDKDVLCDLILNDNIYTIIYYYNKKDLGKKISNLIKVIGQDELIRRTGGSTKTIEFRLQQDI